MLKLITMKKQLTYITLAATLLLGLAACENQENIFPDFIYKTVYFPFQTPMRTLVLGEDRVDNTLDKQLKFNVGVSIGGMYENKSDWSVEVVRDDAMLAGAVNENGDELIALPARYIKSLTPSIPGNINIPSGSFNGTMLVELDPSFLDDPLALSGRYVLPLRIAGTSADSVLSGLSELSSPNRLRDTDWAIKPRDYTLFGITYIAPYHGNYLHKGQDVIKDASGQTIETVKFSNQYLEKNDVWKLETVSKNSCRTNGAGKAFSDDGKRGFIFTVDSSGNVTISAAEGGSTNAKGTGKFIPSSESNQVWADIKREYLALNYTFEEDGNIHTVTDTLVFRDRGLSFETFKVSVK